jgi:hypothetical protein
MHDYIALHWLVPKNQIRDFHHRIPKNQIWVRSDIYDDTWQFVWCKNHELAELRLMEKGMKYQSAHQIAELADGLW